MLRIEEIVGAMDDEFRYSLEALSDERLAQLLADKAALRRLRPVGVSNAEAVAMIVAIQEKRARPAPPPRKPRAPRKIKPASPETNTEEPPPRESKAEPALLEPPTEPTLLEAPKTQGPAIRLAPPQEDAPVIVLGPPPAALAPSAPTPVQQSRIALASPLAGRHALVLGGLSLAIATVLALL